MMSEYALFEKYKKHREANPHDYESPDIMKKYEAYKANNPQQYETSPQQAYKQLSEKEHSFPLPVIADQIGHGMKSLTENNPIFEYGVRRPYKDVTHGLDHIERGLESVSTAPARALGRSVQMGQTPMQNVKAFTNQFAQNPDYAPTYGELNKHAGMPEHIAKPVGEVQKMILSPLNAVGMIPNTARRVSKTVEGWLKNKAEDMAVRTMHGNSKAGAESFMEISKQNPGPLNEAVKRRRAHGRNLLDEKGAFHGLDNIESAGSKMDPIRAKYGQQLGEISKTIDTLAPNSIHGKDIADDIMKYHDSLVNNPNYDGVRSLLKQHADRMRSQPQMTFAEAHAHKQSYKHEPKSHDALVSNKDAIKRMRDIFKEAQTKAAERLANEVEKWGKANRNMPHVSQDKVRKTKELLDEYKTVKHKYSTFKKASDRATNRDAGDQALRFGMSPTDLYTGGASGMASAAMGASLPKTAAVTLLFVAANKFARSRGTAATAKIADRVYKALRDNPTLQSKYADKLAIAVGKGAAPFLLMHRKLMENEDYKSMFEKENK